MLVINVGSSSIKYAAYSDKRLFGGAEEGLRKLPDYDGAVERILDTCKEKEFTFDTVAHRIVHGFGISETSAFDRTVRRHVVLGCHAAPLHNVPQLRVLDRFAEKGVKQVCVFDSFPYEFPDEVRALPLPAALTTKHKLERVGFHGLSHSYVREKAKGKRLISVHLGSGSSVTAWKGSKAVWNSMGFTPEDGVMMATRPGTIDPGTVVYLLRLGFTRHQVEDILARESGLTGVAGTADLKEVLDKRKSGNRYELAFRMLATSVAENVGRAVVHAGGIDTLVFTGTIGVRAGQLRSAVLAKLRFLSFDHDTIETDEEQVIFDQASALINRS